MAPEIAQGQAGVNPPLSMWVEKLTTFPAHMYQSARPRRPLKRLRTQHMSVNV